MKEYVYINGKFVNSNEAKVSFKDGGFQRGNGIFETIRFRGKKLYNIKSHLDRLKSGISYLDFKIDKTEKIALSNGYLHGYRQLNLLANRSSIRPRNCFKKRIFHR